MEIYNDFKIKYGDSYNFIDGVPYIVSSGDIKASFWFDEKKFKVEGFITVDDFDDSVESIHVSLQDDDEFYLLVLIIKLISKKIDVTITYFDVSTLVDVIDHCNIKFEDVFEHKKQNTRFKYNRWIINDAAKFNSCISELMSKEYDILSDLHVISSLKYLNDNDFSLDFIAAVKEKKHGLFLLDDTNYFITSLCSDDGLRTNFATNKLTLTTK